MCSLTVCQVGGLNAASKKSFKVVNRPLFEQAAAALATRDSSSSSSSSSSGPLASSGTAEGEATATAGGGGARVSLPTRALRKVHPPRADTAAGADADGANAPTATTADSTAAAASSLNTSVLDDKEFYHSQASSQHAPIGSSSR